MVASEEVSVAVPARAALEEGIEVVIAVDTAEGEDWDIRAAGGSEAVEAAEVGMEVVARTATEHHPLTHLQDLAAVVGMVVGMVVPPQMVV